MNSPSTNPIISIKNVSLSYPGVKALDEVTFDIERGQVHALVGANGAGKSTMMKVLAGAAAPEDGEVYLNGKLYSPRNPSEAIGMGVSTIYQELNLLPKRSVVENIFVGKEINRFGFLDQASAKKIAAQVLAKMDASAISLDTIVGDLKVSEKQIVEISKALITDCKILIMDEPTAALNDTETAALFRIIKNLKEQGVTIIYVSHRLKEVFQMADKVTVLRDGKHVITATISEVNPESLISYMIGRKVTEAFPRKNESIGSDVLRFQHLSSRSTFQDVSFSLHRGEVIGITGLAGSGKVEFGKALIGDCPIDSGQIFLNGSLYKPDPANARNARFGYLPEDRKKEGVLEELPVLRNISLPSLSDLSRFFGFIIFSRERRMAQSEVDELAIKTTSLSQLVRNLSGGNQQKVSLAKWLAAGSEILLLIEPTQGIDVAVKYEIYKLINKFSLEGKAIILISSEISEIIGLSHRVVVMFNGKLQAILDFDHLSEEDILQHTFGQKKE
ncbi:MAG: sugar ABC transporter ATP-binding protein [Anaerolineaceae bacterium]